MLFQLKLDHIIHAFCNIVPTRCVNLLDGGTFINLISSLRCCTQHSCLYIFCQSIVYLLISVNFFKSQFKNYFN